MADSKRSARPAGRASLLGKSDLAQLPILALVNQDRGIARYEHHHFRGWRVYAKRGNERWAKCFSDAPGPGGRKAALEKERAYRDELYAKLGPAAKVKRRNVLSTTGVVGVVRVQEVGKTGAVIVRFGASWPVVSGSNARRSRSLSFSAGRWGGEENAFRLAVMARKRGVAQYFRDGGLDAVQSRAPQKARRRPLR